jgi:hypothetical protein
MNHKQYIEVLSILPLWRYAVGPYSQITPAIPFYTLSSATQLFNQAMAELPFAGVVLYKRSWLRGIKIIRSYNPEHRQFPKSP